MNKSLFERYMGILAENGYENYEELCPDEINVIINRLNLLSPQKRFDCLYDLTMRCLKTIFKDPTKTKLNMNEYFKRTQAIRMASHEKANRLLFALFTLVDTQDHLISVMKWEEEIRKISLIDEIRAMGPEEKSAILRALNETEQKAEGDEHGIRT